jgi:hypothetical protein
VDSAALALRFESDRRLVKMRGNLILLFPSNRRSGAALLLLLLLFPLHILNLPDKLFQLSLAASELGVALLVLRLPYFA